MQINKRCRHKSPQVGEAGFTLIEMIIVILVASILGTFIFQILTKSLGAQIAMQTRKERDDDAIMAIEKISREVKEAKTISVVTNILTLEKNVTSNADTNLHVEYWLNASTLRRESAMTAGGLPGSVTSTSGDIVAQNVTVFNVSTAQEYGSSVNVVVINLDFADGSNWTTKIQPRNYGL